MPDLSSFTQGTSNIAASDFLIGYVSAAGPGSERRWTAQDLTTGLLSLAGATPNELAHLSGTTGNIQSQLNVVQADIDAHEARVDNPHTVTATQVGLGSVDNTSDVDKPVSTLQASAIGVVQSDVDAHEARTDNPHTVTATQVGLGNVDNTSDTDKPVSTLQQAAIDAAGGGAFDADANTQITPATPILLGQATGNETALTLDYTTNKATSGNDTGLLINMTDTQSPGTSKLVDAQVGGTSKFNVDATGLVTVSGVGVIKSSSNLFFDSTAYFASTAVGNSRVSIGNGVKVGSSYAYEFSATTGANGTADLFLTRDAANTLAQRNGVNAQTYNIYNTDDGAGNYERAYIGWNDVANTFVIGTEAAGAGVARDISINADLVSLQGDNELLRLSHIGASTDALTRAYVTYYRGASTSRIGYSGFSGENTFEIATSFAAGRFRLRTGNQVEAMLVDSAGNVGIGTTPDANAILDVSSTTKAFLPPRMTTTEKNAVASPTAGMVVYDSTLNKLAVYTGAAWEAITSA